MSKAISLAVHPWTGTHGRGLLVPGEAMLTPHELHDRLVSSAKSWACQKFGEQKCAQLSEEQLLAVYDWLAD